MEQQQFSKTDENETPLEAAKNLWSSAIEILLADSSLSMRDKSCFFDLLPQALYDSMIVLSASNDFTRSNVENNLSQKLSSALNSAAGHQMTFVIKLDPQKQEKFSDDSGRKEKTKSPKNEPSKIEKSQNIQTQAVLTQNKTESVLSESAKTESEKTEPAKIEKIQPSADAIAIISEENSNISAENTDLPVLNENNLPDSSNLSAENPENIQIGNTDISDFAHQRVARDSVTHLNLNATFDTFVPEQGSFAYAAVLQVAEQPGTTMNPLCIYGDSGLGKTHLLNAIGNYALQQDPSLKVVYANAEEFTNEFIDAVGASAQNRQAVNNFNNKYRKADILLIDDIQFLSGKEQTLEQFFHTFNALHDANKQIVIASDVAPINLNGFEQRLISRFNNGVVADVKPPNLETRTAILRQKAIRSNIDISSEVIDLIAEQVTTNVRTLEGALTRVAAMSSLTHQPITLSLAQQILKDYFSAEVDITPTDIIKTTAQYFQISFDDIVGPSRTKNVALARQVSMYIARETNNMPLKNIGEVFGGRDHSTVMHACKKIDSAMAKKLDVYNMVTAITAKLHNDSNK